VGPTGWVHPHRSCPALRSAALDRPAVQSSAPTKTNVTAALRAGAPLSRGDLMLANGQRGAGPRHRCSNPALSCQRVPVTTAARLGAGAGRDLGPTGAPSRLHRCSAPDNAATVPPGRPAAAAAEASAAWAALQAFTAADVRGQAASLLALPDDRQRLRSCIQVRSLDSTARVPMQHRLQAVAHTAAPCPSWSRRRVQRMRAPWLARRRGSPAPG